MWRAARVARHFRGHTPYKRLVLEDIAEASSSGPSVPDPFELAMEYADLAVLPPLQAPEQ